MNINTLLLMLLVIAAYVNLYLKLKKLRMEKKRTKLPISSKEWREKTGDESFKSWINNRKRLSEKRKEN